MNDGTSKLYEFQLQHCWNQLPAGTELTLPDKSLLKIITPGTWNFEAGPDFRDAEIKLNGKLLHGPVEVHCRTGDWFRHGHHLDHNYDNVILQVAAEDDLPPASCRPTPPLLLLDPKELQTQPGNPPKLRPGKCVQFFAALTDEQIRRFLTAAGIDRFQHKVRQLTTRFIADGIEETTLQLLFEAMGYKSNRQEFLELYKRYISYPPAVRRSCFEAIIWGESGLLPEVITGYPPEMTAFIERCWRQWWKIRAAAHLPIAWHYRTRPANRPERRLAAVTALLRRYGETPLHGFMNELSTTDYQKGKIIQSAIMHDPLWDNYASFSRRRTRAAAVSGRSRAIEILANVFYPAMAAKAQLERNDNRRIIALWQELPSPQINRIIRDAVGRWFPQHPSPEKLFNSTAAHQGVIHLTREICEKCHGACQTCLLYHSH